MGEPEIYLRPDQGFELHALGKNISLVIQMGGDFILVIGIKQIQHLTYLSVFLSLEKSI